MYGVVLCPKCRRPRGVNLDSKTVTCHCGNRIPIGRVKVIFETENPRELPEALGRIRAELSGQLQEFEETFMEVVRPEPPGRKRSGDARDDESRDKMALKVLRTISDEEGGFELSRAERELDALGLRGAKVLEALIKENLLYEFKKGFYRPI